MKYENLFYCKSLTKRAYQYNGQPLNASWKIKEGNGDVLYDNIKAYEAAHKPKVEPKKDVKRVVKKKAIKKES